MIERLSPFGHGQLGRVIPAAGPKTAQPFALDPPEQNTIPKNPPTEVLDALDGAARVVEDLGRRNIALSFEHDPQTNRVRVKVHHGDMPTQHEISLHGLLNLLDGDMAAISRPKD